MVGVRQLCIGACIAAATSAVMLRAAGDRTHEPDRTSTRPRVPSNASAASVSRVDALGPGGSAGLALSGRGVLVGVWDQAGIRTSHRDLIGRAHVRDASGASDHATHVAGTIIGDGSGRPLARGMAPAAQLWSWGWELDWAEMRENAPYLAVTNHAYGFAMGWGQNPECADRPTFMGLPNEREDRRFGKYGPEAAALDRIIHETGLLSVWAGGNEREDRGAAPGAEHYHFPDCAAIFTDLHDAELALQHDTLGLALASKNALVVGAIGQMPEPTQIDQIAALPFSAFGPMDDGRIKPDVVASGEGILSTGAESDDAYLTFSGTSSSAAVVSGGLALLIEHHRSLFAGSDAPPDFWKALLVHTARAASADGSPNYETGFGLFDASAAAALLSEDAALSGDSRLVRYGALGEDETVELTTDRLPAATDLRVTLAWLDPPGAPNSKGVDDATRALVNDLDLTVIAPDGVEHHPWSLVPHTPTAAATRSGANRVDNVEVVDISARHNVEGGLFRVRVSMSSRPHRLRPQAFALVSAVPLSPTATTTLAAPRHVLWQIAAAGTPAALALPLRSRGDHPIEWHATADAPWLLLDEPRGTTPAELAIGIDAASLSGPGPYKARVIIEAEELDRPHIVGIVVALECTRDCAGRSCGPDPQCGQSCGGCPAGEFCDTAGACEALQPGCPSADLGTSLSPATVSAVVEGGADERVASCGEGGQEHAFRWTAPDDGVYRVSALGRSLSGTLSVRTDGCDGDEVACATMQGPTAGVTVPLAAGQAVIALVDSVAEGGGYTLGVQRAECPDVELHRELGSYLAEGERQFLGKRSRGACGGDGDEAHFGWEAPAAGSYRFDARASAPGTVLHVRSGTCTGDELGCSQEGVLELDLAEGERVIVAVDGENESAPFAFGIHTVDGLCAGNCGGSPNRGECHCDAVCVELGDCCADACASCGHCCVPDCDGKQCGDDGCGGRCGTCGADEFCDGDQCRADECAGLDDGAPCDDRDRCTRGDRCIGGRCAGTAWECQRCADPGCEDRTVADGGTAPRPGADASDREDDPSADDAGTSAPAGSGGCDCRAADPRRPPAALLGAFVAAALARLRRRRSQ